MLRVCFSFGVVVLITFCSIFAGAQEKPLQKTPELLALMAETHQSLELLPVEKKIPVLFQLLSLELRFADKQPALNTIQQVLKLIPSVEKESIKAQMIEAVAFAQADLGDYVESVKTLDQIAKPSVRAEKQLNVAEKILEDIEKTEKSSTDKNEAVKQFEVTDLLRQSLAGAVEAKDAALESLVSVILGRELAKQEKVDESKILFEKARKKARELEDVEEQNIIALIVRNLILVDRQAEALAMIETITNEEDKLHLLGLATITLAQEGKIADAENILKVLKFENNERKDNFISNIALDSVKTITLEQILALVKQISSPEVQKLLLVNMLDQLSKNNRNNIVAELVDHLENVAKNQLIPRLWHLKLLIDAGKFDEAAKFIETMDADLKPQSLRQLVMAKIEQQGEASEELLNQFFATYSEEEKRKIEQFQQETENALKINDPEERLAGLCQVFDHQTQAELSDLRGAWKTLGAMLETEKKLYDDPRIIVNQQLTIADIQIQMYDKSGAKENLRQVQKLLDGIKDAREFKNPFRREPNQPESTVSETTEPSQPILRLNSSADEIEGNDNLFHVYVLITVMWYGIGENDDAKKTFQKAKDIADSESEVIRKIEKLLTLSQLLAQTQSH
jgi:tetratricopeptide (TPR) repeat protein